MGAGPALRQRQHSGRQAGERGRTSSVLLHLWDELEERVREQRSNGQGDEVCEHTAEKCFLRARQDEDSQERGQVNQRNTEEAKAPHCGGTRTDEASITEGGGILAAWGGLVGIQLCSGQTESTNLSVQTGVHLWQGAVGQLTDNIAKSLSKEATFPMERQVKTIGEFKNQE